MVLPAPPPDPGAAEAQAWLGRLISQLERSRGGLLVALSEASPAQLGPVVRALSRVPPWADCEDGILEVCLHAQALLRVPAGSRVLLRVRPEDLEWLNLNRPLFAERALRAILWADAPALDGLVRVAVDTFDWVSRLIPVPPKAAPEFAFEGVRAALDAGVSFCWHGPRWAETLNAAAAEAVPLDLDASLPYHALVERARAPGLPVVAGIGSERDAWRVRMALAQAGRDGSWVAYEPAVQLPGMRELHARQADWDEATATLSAAGWTHPALAAAWLDLEPEFIKDATTRPDQAPVSQADPAQLARDSAPPWLLRAPAQQDALLAARRELQNGDAPGDAAGVVCWSGGQAPWQPNSAGPIEARLTRALRSLRDATPGEELIAGVEAAGFVDVAMALTRVRHQRGEEVPLAGLIKRLWSTGESEAARSIAQEWVTRAHATQDPEEISEASTFLGKLHRSLGEIEAARRIFEEVIAIQHELVAREPRRADVQRELSLSYIELGDLQRDLGNTDLARRYFEDALAIRKRLADAEPDRSDLQRDLSVSYDRLGDLHRNLGNTDLARCFFEDALAIRKRLADAEPASFDLQRDLSLSYIKLGDLHRALGNADLARRFFEDALAIRKRLVGTEPARSDIQRGLSLAYNKLGDLHRALGNADLARRFFDDALAIHKRLADAEPARSDLQRDLSLAYNMLGDLHRDLGNTDLARRFFDDALVIRKHLADAEPARFDLQRDLSLSYINLGDLHRNLGNADLARRFFDDALAIGKHLANAEPARSDLQRNLSLSYERLGDLHRDLGNTDLARRFFDDALAIDRRLADAEPARSDLQDDLAISYDNLGDLHRNLGDAELARRFFDDALIIRKRLADAEPARADLQRGLAVSYERMATVDPLRARHWLDLALALRRQRAAAEPGSAVIRRELAIALYLRANHASDDDAGLLRESLALLQDIDQRGALEAQYHDLLAHLRQRLSDDA